jgi:Mg2+ and Co2+ transporter CorA
MIKGMFEIFGEFNTAEEINQAAAGLKAEGDNESIKKLAKENGLDPEFAQAYIDGDIQELTNDMMAAVGKIELERKNINDSFFSDMKDDMINYLLTQSQDVSFARAIRSKGKTLKGCFEYCKKEIEKKLSKKNGALRDRVVYAMEKDYYFKKEATKDEKEVIRKATDDSDTEDNDEVEENED